MSRASNARLRDELVDGEIFSRYAKPRSSSKVGGAISIQSDRMYRSATSRQHLRCSCMHRRVPAGLRQSAPPATLSLAQQPTLD